MNNYRKFRIISENTFVISFIILLFNQNVPKKTEHGFMARIKARNLFLFQNRLSFSRRKSGLCLPTLRSLNKNLKPHDFHMDIGTETCQMKGKKLMFFQNLMSPIMTVLVTKMTQIFTENCLHGTCARLKVNIHNVSDETKLTHVCLKDSASLQNLVGECTHNVLIMPDVTF